MTNWFQTEECYNFYKSLSFLEAFKYEVRRDGEVKGRIVGYIQKDGGKLKQFFSRRAIINGGPMLAEDITEEELETLLNECRDKLKSKAIYIETRNFDDYSPYRAIFEKNGWKYEPHYNFHVDCTNWDSVEANIGKHRRKYIRLSLRDGASIVENPTIGQVQEFYRLLLKLYKTKVKTTLWPFSFFESLYHCSSLRFILVKYNGQIIGGSVCAVLSDKCMYEWFACGSDGIYKNIHPSSVTKYAGMKYCFNNGIKRFDMMGAGKPGDGGYGVRDFKAEFGGELVEYGRYKCILSPVLYKIGEIGIKLMRKL